MKDIEAQSVHVRITPSEAIDNKRNLLETELHLLNIVKAMISIKGLRKTEFRLKADARVKMRDLTKEIEKILAVLPVSESMLKEGRKKLFEIEPLLKETKEKKERIKIDVELKEIKKQLERLGKQ